MKSYKKNPYKISRQNVSLHFVLLVLFSLFITTNSQAVCDELGITASYGNPSVIHNSHTNQPIIATVCVGTTIHYQLDYNTYICLVNLNLPSTACIGWTLQGSNCTFSCISIMGGLSCTYSTAGTYTVYAAVYDGTQWIGPATVALQVVVLDQPTISFTSTPACSNVFCNGTATAIPTNVGSTYSYYWSNTQTTATATGLCAGMTYTVTATTNNGCAVIGSVTIAPSAPISINILNQNPDCNNNCDGSVLFNVSGGTGPYDFSGSTLTVNSTTEPYTATGLCAGSYTIIVTNVYGCTASALVTINPFEFNPTITGVAEGCDGLCDGMATVGGLNGLLSQYSFSWSSGQTTRTITDLCSGTYTVIVRYDPTGCTASASITLQNDGPCEVCYVRPNPEPQTHPVADQDCWWSTGGNSRSSVSSKNQLGTTDRIPLRLVTDNTEQMRIDKDGNIGINTVFPLQRLHLNGNQLIDGPHSLFFGGDASGNLRDGEYGIEYMDLGGCSQGLNFWKPWLSHNLLGGNGFANYILFLNDDGNVGIGVDPCRMDPDYKLSVCGKIRAQGIEVDAGWCDFVFDKDYKLRTLEEIENYINQNKRLPEFPAGNEIERNGADVAALLSKQMQKIEELTLYLIQLNKEVVELKAKLADGK